jgi:hypothetical protein
VEVFQIMRSAGVRPNLHTYTTVMNLYANVHALPSCRWCVASCYTLRVESGE